MISQSDIQHRYSYFVRSAGIKHIQHQEEGAMWCIQRETNIIHDDEDKPSGGIIGDEMGCGKTLMTISIMVCHPLPRTLIVVPLSLLQQWRQAILKSTGHEPLLYYGRHKTSRIKSFEHTPIVLTTYGVISHKLYENGGNLLFQTKWNRIIYDEAHHMRNSTTKKYMAGSLLKSDIKWLITGTPIQNKKKDLYTLMKLIGIEDKSASFSDYILRRTKSDVGIQLPPLQHHRIQSKWSNTSEEKVARVLHQLTHPYQHSDCKTTESTDHHSMDADEKEQLSHDNTTLRAESKLSHDDTTSYMTCATSHIAESKTTPIIKKTTNSTTTTQTTTTKTIDAADMIYSEDSFNEIDVKIKQYIRKMFGDHYLVYYLRARQMCISPKIMFKLLSNTHRSDLNDPTLLQDAFRGNNKIDEIIKTLKTRCQNGNSKIIFCQFRHEMNLIKERLIHSGYSENDVLVYDGRVSKGRRNKIIRDQPEVLVLQVQMGCEGLNLQFANEIYFVGPLWNPAMEDQAIARCYRLGQTKETHVFKYSMCFSDKSTLSMDNYIEKTLDKKREIQASVYESQ